MYFCSTKAEAFIFTRLGLLLLGFSGDLSRRRSMFFSDKGLFSGSVFSEDPYFLPCFRGVESRILEGCFSYICDFFYTSPFYSVFPNVDGTEFVMLFTASSELSSSGRFLISSLSSSSFLFCNSPFSSKPVE